MPSWGSSSAVTWPTMPEVRRYVPSKETTFDSPVATVAADEVEPKATSSSSNPVISTV